MDSLEYDTLKFKKIVSESKSIRECLIKMNLSPYGGNYRVFKKKIKELNLSTDHFLGQGWNKNNSPADIKDTWMGKPIPLELHHINCNNQDNRLENLLLLCPNCHALTDGYRNRK